MSGNLTLTTKEKTYPVATMFSMRQRLKLLRIQQLGCSVERVW
jgi:hypothetical protein